jgi:twitching motility two-component system response regulator PilH
MFKVLVVDDTPSELEILSRILQQANIEVMQAKDGEEAIALIEDEPPDLVVLDVIMPRMNGFEVIRELRANQKTEKLPVLFCSQKNTEIDLTWGMDLGADAYLTKPIDSQQFLNTVKRFLSLKDSSWAFGD